MPPVLTDGLTLYAGSAQATKAYQGSTVTGQWVPRTNLAPNPRAVSGGQGFSGTNGTTSYITDFTSGPNITARRWVATGSSASRIMDIIPASAGMYGDGRLIRFRCWVRSSNTIPLTIYARQVVSTGSSGIILATGLSVPPGDSVIDITGNTFTGTPGATSGVTITGTSVAGRSLDITSVLIEDASTSVGEPYFDGSTANSPGIRHSWVSTADASPSIREYWTWS